MAKFELSVYDMKTEEVVKTCKRNFMPVNLYVKFQKLSEKLANDQVASDAEMFAKLKDLFLETFPDLTSEEYSNSVDIAQVLIMFRDILNKSTEFTADTSKNA